jgi:hypothetical protein
MRMISRMKDDLNVVLCKLNINLKQCPVLVVVLSMFVAPVTSNMTSIFIMLSLLFDDATWNQKFNDPSS